jgi:hypothetical protein
MLCRDLINAYQMADRVISVLGSDVRGSVRACSIGTRRWRECGRIFVHEGGVAGSSMFSATVRSAVSMSSTTSSAPFTRAVVKAMKKL